MNPNFSFLCVENGTTYALWEKQSVAEEDAGHARPQAGKNFATLSSELNVAEATAEVYGIDCLAAGAELDHEYVAKCLKVSKESFGVIKGEIMANEDKKLRTVWDNLGQLYSYNQIRFVLACLIHDYEL